MESSPQDPNNEEVIGKLCILDIEMPLTASLLKTLGETGSEGLDDLFAFSVPYSTTLLSSIPAFFQEQVDFPVIADQVLGTIYKHPKKWKQLSELIRKDPGTVTLYVCPVTGVPKIISSEETFEIQVNGLAIRMHGTGLSKLTRITHQVVTSKARKKALEYIDEIGFIGAMIEDMSEFVSNLFTIITANEDDAFVDFFQELLMEKTVSIEMDSRTGSIEVNLPDGSFNSDLADSDEETLQDILEEERMFRESEEDDLLDFETEENSLSKEQSFDGEDDQDRSGIYGGFKISREDLKDENSVFVKGNDTQH